MSSTFHELYNAKGTALAGEAHGLRRGHGLPTMGPKPDPDPAVAIVKPRPRGTRPR
jgi:hypothetical protein